MFSTATRTLSKCTLAWPLEYEEMASVVVVMLIENPGRGNAIQQAAHALALIHYAWQSRRERREENYRYAADRARGSVQRP